MRPRRRWPEWPAPPVLLLDLDGVTFLDCAGVNVLLATRRRARLEGGWLRVIRPSARARRTILLLGLADMLMPASVAPVSPLLG